MENEKFGPGPYHYEDCPVCEDDKEYACPVCDMRRVFDGLTVAGMDIEVALRTSVMALRLAYPGENIAYSPPEETVAH